MSVSFIVLIKNTYRPTRTKQRVYVYTFDRKIGRLIERK